MWTEDNLAKYIENPKDFIPKNKMAFVGLKTEKERADVIAYLQKFPAK
jgi:cytochrome c